MDDCPLDWGFYANSTSTPEPPLISKVFAKVYVYYGVVVTSRLNDPLDNYQVYELSYGTVLGVPLDFSLRSWATR